MTAINTSTARAQTLTDGPQLARDNICMGCHQVDSRRVGPPFAAVADRYIAGGPQMVGYLASSIRKGGRGRWGAVPMPAQPQVTEEEAAALAAWILSLASPAQK
ncbi:MAG TPA: c-type cytochrome [Advenella sp.]|nr:c-type cytochrome [Advenella sp.]